MTIEGCEKYKLVIRLNQFTGITKEYYESWGYYSEAMLEVDAGKMSAQNTVQEIPEPLERAVSELRAVSDLSAVSALMAISALLTASACVLRLTAETCAIVIVAKVAVVFNIIIARC